MIVALAAFGGAVAWNFHLACCTDCDALCARHIGGGNWAFDPMHDGAHGLLHPDRKTTHWLAMADWRSHGQRFASLRAYI